MLPTSVLIIAAVMLVPIVAIIGGIWGKAHSDRLRADQRMAMLARGHSLAEIEAILKPRGDVYGSPTPAKDPMRSLGNARRAAVVLISVGVGVILFFLIVAAVQQARPALVGAAIGLIPVVIGLGFVVDYQMQTRELSRFGLEFDDESNPNPRKN